MANWKYPLVTFKGMAMGAADVVPGVSGGTIAFITGIYAELLDTIKSFDLTAIRLLFSGKFGQLWRKINGNFLFALLLGIGISIFSLAKLMTWLLVNQPIATWAFFFGLIIASVVLVLRQVTRWNVVSILCLAGGIAAGYLVTAMSPTTTPDTWWFIMLSGAIAICAMILPGISGSFILLLLGKYKFIMEAVGNFDIPVLLLFAVGAVAGIISFSHFLSWMLRSFHNATVAVLAGFMVGSLNRVWPWKEPLTDSNVLPETYGQLTGSSHLVEAVLCCVAGFLLIWAIDYLSRRIAKTKARA
ncbi:DUF368 domain-containing protein [Alistipes sp. OttesenSCG-928-B03]|nr:DUF368 domain-containing protein [Alistipes sp. OttesenSCG-928-B03]